MLLAIGFTSIQATASAKSITTTELAGDSITLDHLVGMDKKKFKGKTIAEFLDSPEATGYSDITFRQNEEGLLQGIKLKYTDKLYLTVYVDNFRHTNPSAYESTWNLEQLKKETIGEIRVIYVMYQDY